MTCMAATSSEMIDCYLFVLGVSFGLSQVRCLVLGLNGRSVYPQITKALFPQCSLPSLFHPLLLSFSFVFIFFSPFFPAPFLPWNPHKISWGGLISPLAGNENFFPKNCACRHRDRRPCLRVQSLFKIYGPFCSGPALSLNMFRRQVKAFLQNIDKVYSVH